MRRFCTIPEILGIRNWFEKNFGPCCENHDKRYQQGIMTRRGADIQLLDCMMEKTHEKSMLSRWFVYLPFCYVTYLFVRCVGWMYYKK